MEEILVSGPRFGSSLDDGNVFLGGVGEEIFAAGEAVVENWEVEGRGVEERLLMEP